MTRIEVHADHQTCWPHECLRQSLTRAERCRRSRRRMPLETESSHRGQLFLYRNPYSVALARSPANGRTPRTCTRGDVAPGHIFCELTNLQKNSHTTVAFKLQVATLRRGEADFNEIRTVARLAAEPHERSHALPMLHMWAIHNSSQKRRLQITCHKCVGRLHRH